MIRDELSRALDTIGDRLPDPSIVMLVRRSHGDHGVILIRGSVERVTGRSASDFERPTDQWIEMVHPDDRQTVREQLQRLPDVDQARLEYRIRGKSGQYRWIRERLRIRKPHPNAMPEIVGVLRDVTADRKSKARVAGLEGELWRSRKLEAVGTMAGGIVHDFKNLLTVILAAADMLRREPDLPEESVEDVRVLEEAAKRGTKLVQQILQFSAEGEKGVRSLDPGQLLSDLEFILKRVVGTRIRLSVERPEEAWPVQADRTHLEQIILNLASNARDAMPGGGVLHIRISNTILEQSTRLSTGSLRAGEYVRITVRDTGRGMPPEVMERAFEPFFSTKTGEDRGEERHGGYGLTTVLRLVRGYGGGITLDSREGKGTTFNIYLPVREAGEAATVEQTIVGHEIADAGRGRILLVDADRSARNVVRSYLEEEGYSVLGCSSVAEGLTAFDRVRPPFQLLITDVFLPDRSGHDLWRAARRRVTDIPVIYLSGYDADTVAEEGISVSEVSFLSKPVDLADLHSMVDETFSRLDEESDAEASRVGEA